MDTPIVATPARAMYFAQALPSVAAPTPMPSMMIMNPAARSALGNPVFCSAFGCCNRSTLLPPSSWIGNQSLAFFIPPEKNTHCYISNI
jgi:hypothetical protein